MWGFATVVYERHKARVSVESSRREKEESARRAETSAADARLAREAADERVKLAEVNDGAVQLIDGYPVDRDAQAREKWVIPHALRESWTTRDGAPLTVRGLVALVMARFRIKERRGDVRTRFSRYSDGAHLSPREGRQLAERVAQSGPTFSLESSGGLIEGMFCGPTYLIV